MFVFFIFIFEVKSEMFLLDDLKNPGKTIQGQEWSFFTDKVMGGFSEGSVKLDIIENIPCYRMTGNVTTKNNGGFIQIRTSTKPKINVSEYQGIFAYIYGNNKNYNLHLRTGLTVAPWQYYSYTFFAPKKWHQIKAPFAEFKKSNFYQPNNVLNQKLSSIGLVAGFEDFKSDICLAKIGLY